MDDKTIDSPALLWDHLGLVKDTLEMNNKGTIVSSTTGTSNTSGLAKQPLSLKQLPRFSLQSDAKELTDSTPTADLNIKETIGQGGMGIVQRAVQVPLQRDVAVKRVHPEKRHEKVRDALLREAWITGLLEHPNIIPIHALGMDASDSPMFVMKRIEGESWQSLLAQPEHPWIQSSSRDPFLWHLEIFVQLCNAVHFAHSKGIIHRDLKLENVMIGAFGEVYLLDWGIAVSVKEHPSLPLPLVTDIDSIIGTPSSMAPEMVKIDAAQIGPRTDIYLLGTILHELITHHPRHPGSNVKEVLFSAYLSEPFSYDSSVPEELAHICNKAMHAEPEQRFENAEALRIAIDNFVQHRSSIQLNAEAYQILEEMKLAVTQEEAEAEDQRLRIYSLFSECRFGFTQALRIWDNNPHALQGLEEALTWMIEYEIQQEDHKAAQLHYDALQQPNAALKERLGVLEQLSKNKEKQLQQLLDDRDLNIGKQTRFFLSVAGGVVFLPFSLFYSKTLGIRTFTYTSFYFFDIVFLGIMLFITLWAKETMFRTAVNRSILVSLWSLACLMLIHTTGMLLLGTSARDAFAQTPFLYGLQTAATAALVEVRLFWAAGVFMLAFFGCMTFPIYTFEITAVSVFFGLLFTGLAWRHDLFERGDNLLQRIIRPNRKS